MVFVGVKCVGDIIVSVTGNSPKIVVFLGFGVTCVGVINNVGVKLVSLVFVGVIFLGVGCIC